MTDTDGNLYALNKHLAECEEYDRHQELLAAEEDRDELADRVDTLNDLIAKAESALEQVVRGDDNAFNAAVWTLAEIRGMVK